jgi:serralysin
MSSGPSPAPLAPSEPGTAGDDIFATTSLDLEDEMIDGAGGNDTLHLIDGGTFDLTTLQGLASIETIQGSGEHDTIVLNDVQAVGVTVFDGGDAPAAHWDEVVLVGESFDFSTKTLIAIDRLSLQSDNAVITVADMGTALRVSGIMSQNDTLMAPALNFTAAQIATLHKQGIDTIMDAAGTHTNLAPVAEGLDGDSFEAKAGDRVFVDEDLNATLSEDDGAIALLSVEAP